MKTELEERTFRFAAEVVRFCGTLSRSAVADVLSRQLLRSGTSVGASYREANRSASKAEFLHRINLAEREAAETEYWLMLMDHQTLGAGETRKKLLGEVRELPAILVSISRKARRGGGVQARE